MSRLDSHRHRWIGRRARAADAILAALPAELRRADRASSFTCCRRSRADLVSLLGRQGGRRVCEPEDKEPLERQHDLRRAAELSPARSSAPVRSRCRSTSRVNYSRPSIDVLFESAADAYGQHTIGVLLSGSNADGAAGLQADRRRRRHRARAEA